MTLTWLSELQARADQSPSSPRETLRVADGDGVIGSIEPALARRMAGAGLPISTAADGWRIEASALNEGFARVADWLRAHGLASAWRDELLGVTDASGRVVGKIERAAVRPLGITTRAVHLVGWAEQGGVWVQQRALDKSTDPGLWDTLMGGLMAASETIEDTLARETWEEAGLRVEQLRDLTARGTLTVRRPVSNGYMVEHIHVYDATLPAGLVPENQDGEVAAFECLGIDALQARLHDDAFTLEAALILERALALRKRG